MPEFGACLKIDKSTKQPSFATILGSKQPSSAQALLQYSPKSSKDIKKISKVHPIKWQCSVMEVECDIANNNFYQV